MVGTTIAHYEIESLLGVGGMGEVYKAKDTRLGRSVAIKVVPEIFLEDKERLARFQREARILASLNHPHIATIHGLEELHGRHFLVMELVPGETLAERIKRGPIPVEDALSMAKQIAEALEAAHEQGIIHRDLKPANIKVKDDGSVKVLDFGLAKAIDPHTSTQEVLTNSPTLTASPTVGGVVLGTAAYMSREQARGKAVDRRADIWAFGCVLYEMLTGKQAFPGEDMSETLANVLKSEPDWHELPAETPPQIRRLLKRCVTKEMQKREPHIGGARLDLEESADAQKYEPPRSYSGASRWMVAVTSVAVLVGLAASALLFWQLRGSSSDRSVDARRRYAASVVLPEGVRFTPTTVPAWRLGLSPDGTRLAFAASGSDGVQRLYVRPLDTSTAQPLAGTESARAPFWSPDGKFIGYFGNGKLMKVPLNGGLPTPICDYSLPVFGAHWTSNGDILFSSGTPPGSWVDTTRIECRRRFISRSEDGRDTRRNKLLVAVAASRR